MLYDPMLRWCITFAWAWKNKTKKYKKRKFWNGIFIEIAEKMVLQKLCDTAYKNQLFNFLFNAYTDSAYP